MAFDEIDIYALKKLALRIWDESKLFQIVFDSWNDNENQNICFYIRRFKKRLRPRRRQKTDARKIESFSWELFDNKTFKIKWDEIINKVIEMWRMN